MCFLKGRMQADQRICNFRFDNQSLKGYLKIIMCHPCVHPAPLACTFELLYTFAHDSVACILSYFYQI